MLRYRALSRFPDMHGSVLADAPRKYAEATFPATSAAIKCRGDREIRTVYIYVDRARSVAEQNCILVFHLRVPYLWIELEILMQHPSAVIAGDQVAADTTHRQSEPI